VKQRRKLSKLFIYGCLAIFIFSCTASNKTEDKINLEIHKAKEMLNSWSGQSHLLEEAREILGRILEENPQNHLALKEIARYQIKAGFINSRLAQYKTYKYQIGNYIPGTLERAEETIRKALRINPRFAEGYVLLGHIHFEQTKFDEAEKALSRAETIGTDDPWLHLNWAALHNARGEYSAATTRWQLVVKSETSNKIALTSAYNFMIENYRCLGEHDKAIALFEDQIKRHPTNAWARGNFAEYLSSILGRNDEAINQARSALKIMNYGMGRKTLAMALYRKWADMVAQGNEEAGEKYFLEAWKIYPQLNKVMVYGASMPKGKQLAKALMAKKGVSINACVEDGSTALLVATNLNRVQTVKDLLDLNANPNVHDKVGWTPLLSAADEGNAEIVDVLLANGADIRSKLRGKDAAFLAQRRGKTDLAALLKKRASELK